jgi:hypothetical protein
MLLTAIACGSDKTTGPAYSVAGTWTGAVGQQQLSLTLVESGGLVNGTGTLANTPTGTRALTVTGTFKTTNGTLDATLTSGTLQPFNLHGAIIGGTMVGSLNGSGFDNASITLTRQ